MEKAISTKVKNRKKQVKKNANPIPLYISVKTDRGNIVTMRRIPDEEIQALRNPAYEYLY